jgi:hypothetical protein
MKSAVALSVAIALCIISATISLADVPRPKPSPKQARAVYNMGLAIEPDSKSDNARLQIPESSVKDLRDALGRTSSDGPAGGSSALNSRRTIFAGLSLFLALSFGGVWLVRSTSSRGQKTITAALIGATLLSAAAIISRANAGPPPAYRWRPLVENLNQGKTTYGSVEIEIVPEGQGLKLIVPLPKKSGPTDE